MYDFFIQFILPAVGTVVLALAGLAARAIARRFGVEVDARRYEVLQAIVADAVVAVEQRFGVLGTKRPDAPVVTGASKRREALAIAHEMAAAHGITGTSIYILDHLLEAAVGHMNLAGVADPPDPSPALEPRRVAEVLDDASSGGSGGSDASPATSPAVAPPVLDQVRADVAAAASPAPVSVPSPGRLVPLVLAAAAALALLVGGAACVKAYMRDPRTVRAYQETITNREADVTVVERIAGMPDGPAKTMALQGFLDRNRAELDRLRAERDREQAKPGAPDDEPKASPAPASGSSSGAAP